MSNAFAVNFPLILVREIHTVTSTRLSDEIGRHARLKIWCPLGCVGSSPTSGTITSTWQCSYTRSPNISSSEDWGIFCNKITLKRQGEYNKFSIFISFSLMIETSCWVISFIRVWESVKYLLIHHTKGHRGFPKWHIENKESFQETAIREFQEETGIDSKYLTIPHPDYITDSYYITPDQEKIVHYFIGEITEEGTKNISLSKAEVSEYKICSPEEVLQLLDFPWIQNIFKTIIYK